MNDGAPVEVVRAVERELFDAAPISSRRVASGEQLPDESAVLPHATMDVKPPDADSKGTASVQREPGSWHLALAWRLPAGLLIWLLAVLSWWWAFILNTLFVRPLRLLRVPPAPICALAHRPLLAFQFVLAAPILLDESSLGIDFAALPGERPRSLRELLQSTKGPGRHKKLVHSRHQVERKLASQGITHRLLGAHEFSPGIEHRRLFLHHARRNNASLLSKLFWVFNAVCALPAMHLPHVMLTAPARAAFMHLLVTSEAVEFRSADGQLVALSLLTTFGGYACASFYAAHESCSRSGIWRVLQLQRVLVATESLTPAVARAGWPTCACC